MVLASSTHAVAVQVVTAYALKCQYSFRSDIEPEGRLRGLLFECVNAGRKIAQPCVFSLKWQTHGFVFSEECGPLNLIITRVLSWQKITRLTHMVK